MTFSDPQAALRELAEHAAADKRAMWEAALDDGEYVRAFYWWGSEDVAAALVEFAAEWSPDDDELRAVLLAHWDRCDGSGPCGKELLGLLHRVGFISDTGRTFSGEVVAYRGNLGEDPRLGLSWTLSKARGRWFALYARDSSRARFLGLSRADGNEPVATVWRAVVDAATVLGYFGKRRESELILDPASVRDAEVILRPH